jgi:hypothetical protein
VSDRVGVGRVRCRVGEEGARGLSGEREGESERGIGRGSG